MAPVDLAPHLVAHIGLIDPSVPFGPEPIVVLRAPRDAGHPAAEPTLTLTAEGAVVLGPPMDGPDLARLAHSQYQANWEINRIVLALANEVARLRMELEHVKTRVT